MFRISRIQEKEFSDKELDDFTSRSVEFLRKNFGEWIKGKQQLDLIKFVRRITNLATKYGIYKEINIQKLMLIEVRYSILDKPEVAQVMEYTLDYAGRSEDLKVEYFHKQIIYAYANPV